MGHEYSNYFFFNGPSYSTLPWDSTVTICISNIDSLLLPQLEKLSGQQYRMSTDNLPDTVYIQLAFHAATASYDELYIEQLEAPLTYKVIYKDILHEDWELEVKEEPVQEDEQPVQEE